MIQPTDFDQTIQSLEAERDRALARYWELVGAINASRHWQQLYKDPPGEDAKPEEEASK